MLGKWRVGILLLLSISIVGLSLTLKTDKYGGLHFTQDTPTEGTVLKRVAYISGAISKPGVYEVASNTRVGELVAKAGGFSVDAEPKYVETDLNLSKVVEDEQHIYIPSKNFGKTASSVGETGVSINSDQVSLNTASIAELMNLPGVGEATAQKIVSSRPFAKVEDLLDVPGIGETKYGQLKDLVRI